MTVVLSLCDRTVQLLNISRLRNLSCSIFDRLYFHFLQYMYKNGMTFIKHLTTSEPFLHNIRPFMLSFLAIYAQKWHDIPQGKHFIIFYFTFTEETTQDGQKHAASTIAVLEAEDGQR